MILRACDLVTSENRDSELRDAKRRAKVFSTICLDAPCKVAAIKKGSPAPRLVSGLSPSKM